MPYLQKCVVHLTPFVTVCTRSENIFNQKVCFSLRESVVGVHSVKTHYNFTSSCNLKFPFCFVWFSVLPSHESPVWTERHRRPRLLRLSGWASPQCSHARPAAPPAGAGAWAHSWWVVWCLHKTKKKRRKEICVRWVESKWKHLSSL